MSKTDLAMNAVVMLFCAFALFPLYWLVSSSFKYSANTMKIPPDWFPIRFTLTNFRHIFENSDSWRWIFNSLFIATTSTCGIVLVSSLAGYGLARVAFPGRKAIVALVVAGIMLPKEVYLLPLYELIVDFHWLGTMRSLILPDLVMPFGVFLLMSFYREIPNEIFESAELDGSSKLKSFLFIGLPLTKPGLGALSILAFIHGWNNYLWQFVMAAGHRNLFTLPVGVAYMFDDSTVIDYGLKYAAATVAAIPLLLIFILFQRFFTSGITSGAVK